MVPVLRHPNPLVIAGWALCFLTGTITILCVMPGAVRQDGKPPQAVVLDCGVGFTAEPPSNGSVLPPENCQWWGGRVSPPLPARPIRHVLMNVSAFCACRLCCGPHARGITASGKPVEANGGRFCAADGNIPFGTMIDIPGYGCVPVLDRGGAIKGDKLDVFFPTHAQALAWGRQRLLCRVNT